MLYALSGNHPPELHKKNKKPSPSPFEKQNDPTGKYRMTMQSRMEFHMGLRPKTPTQTFYPQ